MCSEFEEMASPDPAQTYPPLAPFFPGWRECELDVWRNLLRDDLGKWTVKHPRYAPGRERLARVREHHAKGLGTKTPLS